MLALLAQRGLPIWIDKGAGGEEAERVERAVARSGADVRFWEGSFAGFAAIIAGSALYVGYDSAGQHVAAACGVPLISIFAGFPAPRMFDRWRPVGAGAARDPRGRSGSGEGAAKRERYPSVKSGGFRLGFSEDRYLRIGFFPSGEESLKRGFGLGVIAGEMERLGARLINSRKQPPCARAVSLVVGAEMRSQEPLLGANARH